MRRSNTPLLLAILVEAMGYGAIFGLLADLQDHYGFADYGLGLIAAIAFPAALIGQLGLSRFADRGFTRALLWAGFGHGVGRDDLVLARVVPLGVRPRPGAGRAWARERSSPRRGG